MFGFGWLSNIYKLLADLAAGKNPIETFRQRERFRGPTTWKGSRGAPDSQRSHREANGIPHGYPGAKLARMAMEKRITIRS